MSLPTMEDNWDKLEGFDLNLEMPDLPNSYYDNYGYEDSLDFIRQFHPDFDSRVADDASAADALFAKNTFPFSIQTEYWLSEDLHINSKLEESNLHFGIMSDLEGKDLRNGSETLRTPALVNADNTCLTPQSLLSNMASPTSTRPMPVPKQVALGQAGMSVPTTATDQVLHEKDNVLQAGTLPLTPESPIGRRTTHKTRDKPNGMNMDEWRKLTKPEKCEICGLGFVYSRDLRRHYEVHHVPKGQRKRKRCWICGKEYPRPDHVRRHMKSKHPSALQ